MEQPLAISPTSPTRAERELQASRPYGTPLLDLRQMLQADVPQDQMMCLFLYKKRKLSDLNTVIGNNTRFILIGDVCEQGRAQWSMNLSHKKIGKHRVQPSPGGRVAVSEQILPHKQTEPTVGVLCTELVVKWQCQARKSRTTAPRKENRATVASLSRTGRSQL